MVKIAGKYQYDRQEGFEEYLNAIADSPDAFQKYGNSNPGLDIKDHGGDKWEITILYDEKSISSSFKLGESYDEAMPNGITVKSVTKREGDDKFVTETDVPGRGNKAIRIYEFTDKGITVHLSDPKSGAKAKRFYKRL